MPGLGGGVKFHTHTMCLVEREATVKKASCLASSATQVVKGMDAGEDTQAEKSQP